MGSGRGKGRGSGECSKARGVSCLMSSFVHCTPVSCPRLFTFRTSRSHTFEREKKKRERRREKKKMPTSDTKVLSKTRSFSGYTGLVAARSQIRVRDNELRGSTSASPTTGSTNEAKHTRVLGPHKIRLGI